MDPEGSEADGPGWGARLRLLAACAALHAAVYELTRRFAPAVELVLLAQTVTAYAMFASWRLGWRAGLLAVVGGVWLTAALDAWAWGKSLLEGVSPGRLAGYTTAVVGVIVVSRFAKASRSLHTSQLQLARFRAVLDEAADAIFVADPVSWMILDTNETACNMLGYTRQELLAKSLADIEIAEDVEALSADPLPRQAGDLRLRTERSFVRRDGTTLPVEVIRAQKSFRGRAYMVAVARDLSERRRIEERLLEVERKRLADQAESKVRLAEQRLTQSSKLASLGTLAAGIGHEINNPLTYVLGNLQYLSELLNHQRPHLPAAAYKELDELLTDTWDGAGRIRGIVRDLKIFSRQDDDNMLARLAVREVVEDALKLVRSQLRYRAELSVELAAAPDVRANRSRLTQVLVNLLINAAQAIDERAKVRRISVKTCQAPDGSARIEVEDTGMGIPEEQLDRIFDPFFTTKSGAGTGLGLAICHEIVSGFGGALQVDSLVGRGTTMRVTLPAAGPMTVHPSPPSDKPKDTHTVEDARVLVVDDEPYVAKMFTRILRGADVSVVYSAQEALARLREDDGYDVVFCDLMMPEMTGMELFQTLRDTLPHYIDRTLFITGGAFTPEAREFLERHADSCLEKPLSNQQVRAIVRDKRAMRAA